MSKSIALAAFNAAVVITNVGHATKRCAVKAAQVTAKHTATTAAVSKEAGIAFWAGMKYAHQHNKANAAAAECLTSEDIEASKPKTAKTSAVAKRIAK